MRGGWRRGGPWRGRWRGGRGRGSRRGRRSWLLPGDAEVNTSNEVKANTSQVATKFASPNGTGVDGPAEGKTETLKEVAVASADETVASLDELRKAINPDQVQVVTTDEVKLATIEDTKGTGSDEVKIGLPDEVGIATSDVARVVGPIEVTAMTRDNAKPTSTADGDNQTNKEE